MASHIDFSELPESVLSPRKGGMWIMQSSDAVYDPDNFILEACTGAFDLDYNTKDFIFNGPLQGNPDRSFKYDGFGNIIF